MKINLNSDEYGIKQILTKDNILSYIDEYSIFRHYAGQFTVGSIMSSPFRRDNQSSFGIFYSKQYSCLLYKDLAKGTCGDCFSLVANEVHTSYTYVEALAQVAVDFGLDYHFVMPRLGFTKIRGAVFINQPNYKERVIKSIGIKARPYTLADYTFWGQFGISRQMLRYYNVVPISHFTYGTSVFTAEKYAYAYIEYKDGHTTYKVYQPHSTKIKFFTDMDASIHAGYTQLPEKGDLLLITKSLKDVMSIREICNIPSISVLSETILIKKSVIDEYKSRFKDVVVFFDNDAAGKRMAEEYRKTFNLDIIFIPKIYKSKDFTDVVKAENESAAKIMLETMIWLLKYGEIDDLPF